MVEAAGVEPASGTDQRGTSPCAAPSRVLSPAAPRRGWKAASQPVVFRLRVPGRVRQAIPQCDVRPAPRGRRNRRTGCLSSQRERVVGAWWLSTCFTRSGPRHAIPASTAPSKPFRPHVGCRLDATSVATAPSRGQRAALSAVGCPGPAARAGRAMAERARGGRPPTGARSSRAPGRRSRSKRP
jgi:hypothetical protein